MMVFPDNKASNQRADQNMSKVGWGPQSNPAKQVSDKAEQKQNQENNEQDFCDPRRRHRDARKTENGRDDRNNEESQGPT
jgi:hypothetical protein